MTGPKPHRLSPEWKALLGSPYVQDTLLPLLGGKMPVVLAGDRPRGVSGDVKARTVYPDTVWTYSPAADRYVLTHEAGHVFDNREVAPDVVDDITLNTRARPGTYAASAPNEHFAEAFARAVASQGRQFADSAEADDDVPGTQKLIRWMIGKRKKHGGE